MRRAPSSMMADLPLLVCFHFSKVSYILRFMAVPPVKRAYCTMLHMATSRAEWSISRDSIGLNLHVFKGFAKRKSTRFQRIRTTRLLISLYVSPYRYSHLPSLISHLSTLRDSFLQLSLTGICNKFRFYYKRYYVKIILVSFLY